MSQPTKKQPARANAPRQPRTPATVGALVRYDRNARTHGERNLALIERSLQEVGPARSIVIDERGRILAGEGVTTAAKRLGLTKLQVVDVDGDTLVAVRRVGLTEAQKARLALYDNRTNETSEWNVEQLRKDYEAGVDLSAFFEPAELEALFKVPGDSGDGHGAGASDEPPAGLAYREQFGVIVICADEAEQQRVFERLTGDGLQCRVVVT